MINIHCVNGVLCKYRKTNVFSDLCVCVCVCVCAFTMSQYFQGALLSVTCSVMWGVRLQCCITAATGCSLSAVITHTHTHTHTHTRFAVVVGRRKEAFAVIHSLWNCFSVTPCSYGYQCVSRACVNMSVCVCGCMVEKETYCRCKWLTWACLEVKTE